jgi:hypothetical protein
MTTDPFTEELLRLAREQTDLLSSQFLAPVKPGCQVLVRLGGKWRSMMIVPPSFEGWGVFRPLTLSVALFCRDATVEERSSYPTTSSRLAFADHHWDLQVPKDDATDTTLGVALRASPPKPQPPMRRPFRSPPRFS